MGVVVQFPIGAGGRFGADMRDALGRFAARTPGVQPLSFDETGDGSVVCRFGNGLMIGRDRRRRLILIDASSGYIDHGPFDGLEEVLSVVEYLSG